MPRPFEPIPLYIPTPPPPSEREGPREEFGDKVAADKPQRETVFTLSMGGDDTDDVAASDPRHEKLLVLQAGVRKLADAGERLTGWERLLEQVYKRDVENLTVLPADNSGNRFYAEWGTPMLGAMGRMASLKVWYGRADESKLAVGRKAMAIRVGDNGGMIVDCALPSSSLDPNRPEIETYSNFAETVMGLGKSLHVWASRVSGRHIDAPVMPKDGILPSRKGKAPVPRAL
ncbi:MAG: hypothetical protein KGQ41_06855 [Alphaproteobacteria bacterium]|nr:hypothetical protein [Alphaproteobacteria bacterium]